MKSIKCPWCGSKIQPHKGRVASHLTPGGVKCISIGIEWNHAVVLRRFKDEDEAYFAEVRA